MKLKEPNIFRRIIFAVITGIIIGFFYVAGYYLDNFDTLDIKQKLFYVQWAGAALLSSACVYFLWLLMEYIGKKNEKKSTMIERAFWLKCERITSHWGCVVILVLCWLPAFLSIFPGAFSYDAYSEWEQVRRGAITSHHPVAHVLLLGGIVEVFYNLTGSYNVGIAVYTLLQMFLLANIFGAAINFLKKFNIPVIFRVLALAFYGLSPVVQLFSVCATKDVLFSGAELLFFFYAILFFCRRDAFFTDRKNRVGFAAATLGTMILRNNGLYIVLCMLIIMAFYCRKYWKKYLLMVAGVLLLYGFYTGPVYGMLSVTKGGIEEMLSVPIQQMARVHKYDYASLETEDLELLYQVLPKEALDEYRATVSDFVKKDFNREGFAAHKTEIFRLWLKWGMEHPLTYVNSFLINTVDFWYPMAVVDGYRDAYGRSSYFDYRVDEPGTEQSLLPKLHNFYENISINKEAQTQPFAFLVLSPGWYFVLVLVSFMYLWCCRQKKLLGAFLILILSMATVLLGPMALVRYVLIFYYVFPVLPTLCLYPKRYTMEK